MASSHSTVKRSGGAAHHVEHREVPGLSYLIEELKSGHYEKREDEFTFKEAWESLKESGFKVGEKFLRGFLKRAVEKGDLEMRVSEANHGLVYYRLLHNTNTAKFFSSLLTKK